MDSVVRAVRDDVAPMVRILADETDSDGLGMVRELRARGADADIWSLDFLDVDHASGALAYRGADVMAPEFAIAYHPRLSAEKFEKLYAMERHGVPMANSVASIERSIDKGKTAVLLREAGIPHPDTIEVHSADAAMRAVERLHREGVPVFFKNPVGTQGVGVAGIVDHGDALDVARFIAANGDPAARGGGVLLESSAPLTSSILARTAEDVEAAIELLHRPDRPIRLSIPNGSGPEHAVELRSRGEALAVGQLMTAGLEQGSAGTRLLVQAGLLLPEGVPLHDTRHFVLSRRPITAMDRVQETAGELRTGLHSGAVGRPHLTTPAEDDVAVRTAEALGLDHTAGVDTLADNVLEVNAAPGHRIATVTGVDVPGIIAEDALARIAAQRRAATTPQ